MFYPLSLQNICGNPDLAMTVRFIAFLLFRPLEISYLAGRSEPLGNQPLSCHFLGNTPAVRFLAFQSHMFDAEARDFFF